MAINTKEHSPSLLAAWAQHNGGSIHDAPVAFHAFAAGYEAHAATVADALAGLRAAWIRQRDWYSGDDELFERGCEIDIRIGELDYTIAALGLQAAESAEGEVAWGLNSGESEER